MQAEIYMLTIGLRNHDFRPGPERDNAMRRLHHLKMLAQDGTNRPRGVIILNNNR